MKLFVKLVKPVVGLSTVLSLLTVTTTALPVNETDLLQVNKPHFKDLLAALKHHDEDGIVHLGDDGVLRSFAPDLSVVDYVQLNPQQIQEAIHHRVYKDDIHEVVDGKNVTTHQHLLEVYEDVNGEDVTELEHLLHPGEHLLPPGFVAAMKAPKTTPNPNYPRGDITLPVHYNPRPDSMCVQRRCARRSDCFRYLDCFYCWGTDNLLNGECY